MQLIRKYFPSLDREQTLRFKELLRMVPGINEKVNIISRKDIKHLEERHLLHSLAIAKKFTFPAGSTIVDAGTGGGFPGIPLAILFPAAHFILVDSIGKKIRMVEKMADALGLVHVTPLWKRVEDLDMQADYVVSRAVAPLPRLHEWTRSLLEFFPFGKSSDGGLISLKGGNLEEELKPFGRRVECYPIYDWFSEPFFLNKTVVYLKK
jgi:16S rRNA (guanine527-N7)-methyltransferase